MSSSKAMFTGLIEAVGHVAEVARAEQGLQLRIRTSLAPELSDGESISVNGVCLTATRIDGTEFQADIGPETARVTTLGRLRRDESVNLERAMRADDRFGGHFVQGHVDGVGTVRQVRADGDAHWLEVGFPAALAPFFIAKGSVAVDGVSLTVAALAPEHFDIMIIPFTWTHTTLASLQAGAQVNLECDVIGKYVARAVQIQKT
jgi:riboflavin synthase